MLGDGARRRADGSEGKGHVAVHVTLQLGGSTAAGQGPLEKQEQRIHRDGGLSLTTINEQAAGGRQNRIAILVLQRAQLLLKTAALRFG